jgi:hypothetical protein
MALLLFIPKRIRAISPWKQPLIVLKLSETELGFNRQQDIQKCRPTAGLDRASVFKKEWIPPASMIREAEKGQPP